MINGQIANVQDRFPGVTFYNPGLVEIQDGVTIGAGSRVGSFTLIHAGAQIGANVTIGSHCNICRSRIGDGVSIQTACHVTKGSVIEDDVFIGPGVIMLNDKLTDRYVMTAPVIRRGAKIGGGSVLLPGVEIGAGAVIGAGSVVTANVAAGAVVFGDAARVKSLAGHARGE